MRICKLHRLYTLHFTLYTFSLHNYQNTKITNIFHLRQKNTLFSAAKAGFFRSFPAILGRPEMTN